MNKADRSWFQDADDDVTVEMRTEAALERVTNQRAIDTRAKIAEQKRNVRRIGSRPVSLGKMHPVSYWADIVGFETTTVYEWCKSGVLGAQWIRGQWRISEKAMTEFLEKEMQTRVRKG